MRNATTMRLLALLATVGLVASACGSTSSESAAEDDTTESNSEQAAGPNTNVISYGIVEPSWIDSFNTQDSNGFEVARLLYDGLTDYGENLEPVPAIATEWSTDDNITWTFALRDDATFHDGTPVTAQSFVDAFNRVANPDNLSDVSYQGSLAGISGWGDVTAGDAPEVTGAVAVDDTTLEITLETAYPVLPKVLSHPAFSPVSLAAVEAGGDSYSDSPIGNGPYQMQDEWEHDVSISLTRNENYYGNAGKADGIQFTIYDSLETMYLEAQAGNLDIAGVPPENIESAEIDFDGRYIDIEIGSFNYLGFPIGIAPFDNVDIRKALSMSIDRQTISDAIFAGTRAPANGFTPPLAPGATSGCENTEYDPDMAKELFDAAGGIPGNAVTIYFNSGGGHEEWTQAVANGWLQTLGVEATFEAQEFAPYLDQLQGGEVAGPFRLGWSWDAPTSENFLTPLYGSGSTDNYSGFSNADFDAAIEDFRAAPSEVEGFPALATAQDILCEKMPVAPMFFGRGQKVYSENVDNVIYSVFGFTLLEQVEVNG